MSIHQENRPGQVPTGVEITQVGSGHAENSSIPQQRGQERRPKTEEGRERTGKLRKRIVAGSLVLSGLVSAGSVAYAAGKGPEEVSGTPVAAEALPNPGNEAPAPNEGEAPLPNEEIEASAVEARGEIENKYIFVTPETTSLGVNGLPTYDEMEAANDGSKLNLDGETTQHGIDLILTNLNAAGVRGSTDFAESDDELGKSTVDLSLNTGTNPEESYQELSARVMAAAEANQDIPRDNGELPFGVVQIGFEYDGSEIKASSPHPNTDIFEVPGQLTGKYVAMVPGEDGTFEVKEFDLGAKLPSGEASPLVLSEEDSYLKVGMFKPGTKLGGNSGALYVDLGETPLAPAN